MAKKTSLSTPFSGDINPIERPDRQAFTSRSSSISLQKAIVESVREAVGDQIGIWDGTNRKPSYPFIKIGEELTSGTTISKDTTAKNHNLTLHIWSDMPDTSEVKQVGDFLIGLLIDSPLLLEDGFCISSKGLDHVRYTEASSGVDKESRGYLFLDFTVADSWTAPQ